MLFIYLQTVLIYESTPGKQQTVVYKNIQGEKYVKGNKVFFP